MVDTLTESGYYGLQIQLTGFEPRWQPACTVCPDVLQAYFAKQGGETVEARQHRHAVRRDGTRRPRKTTVFGDWSSESAKTTCMCNTHEESVSAVKTSSSSAGFLIAATETGVIPGLKEIITAETMSQRYIFLAEMAEAEQELQGTVHDDNCHNMKFAKKTEAGSVCDVHPAEQA